MGSHLLQSLLVEDQIWDVFVFLPIPRVIENWGHLCCVVLFCSVKLCMGTGFVICVLVLVHCQLVFFFLLCCVQCEKLGWRWRGNLYSQRSTKYKKTTSFCCLYSFVLQQQYAKSAFIAFLFFFPLPSEILPCSNCPSQQQHTILLLTHLSFSNPTCPLSSPRPSPSNTISSQSLFFTRSHSSIWHRDRTWHTHRHTSSRDFPKATTPRKSISVYLSSLFPLSYFQIPNVCHVQQNKMWRQRRQRYYLTTPPTTSTKQCDDMTHNTTQQTITHGVVSCLLAWQNKPRPSSLLLYNYNYNHNCPIKLLTSISPFLLFRCE